MYWTNRYGKSIKISNLDNYYLKNIVLYVHNNRYGRLAKDTELMAALRDEAKKRGMYEEIGREI